MLLFGTAKSAMVAKIWAISIKDPVRTKVVE